MFRTRASALLLAVCCFALLFAAPAEAKKHVRHGKGHVSRAAGVNDPRYADIIMNPVTGEIYHEHDPDGKRYPASLTKMMTLYLLFEALEQHRLKLDDNLKISEYATTMPQTNLSLSPGDTIEVETAIKALVVRSANDVAVVVGESLGGNVNDFAVMMTAKARQLGMKNTVFRNPNGLPNPDQHTTARDMAKLGIALKRDFPRYYRYFSTLQFSHDGVTYYTHNRVMLRYAGVDGIKTGFIGASGFNLVTSVVRGGRPLVGAVMGGPTGAWRDNRMIELLDDSYQVVASRGAVRGKLYPQNLPLAKNGKGLGVDEANLTTEANPELTAAQNGGGAADGAENEDGSEALPAAVVPEDRNAVRQPVTPAPVPSAFDAADAQQAPAKVAVPQTQAAAAARAPIIISAPVPAHSGAVTPQVAPSHSKIIQLSAAPSAPPAANSPFAMAPTGPETMIIQPATPPAAAAPAAAPAAPATSAANGWGIQVGAFSTQALAVQASRTAIQVAAKPLASAKLAMADPAGGSVPVHRARLENLTQPDARKACEMLIANNSPCFIYKVAGSAN